jgi:sigma-E factor negative regulatory protein RseA
MMTEKLREQISALADNELPDGEHELLARRFALEKYLSSCWERYHLIGEAMRKALPQVDTRGFADRIMEVLDGEIKTASKSNQKTINYFSKTAAGLTVAVGVAVIAIFGLRHNGTRVQTVNAPSEIVPQESTIQSTPTSYDMLSNANWNGNAPEVREELSNFVINHNEVATALEQQGMLPYFYITASRRGQSTQKSRAPQLSNQQTKR